MNTGTIRRKIGKLILLCMATGVFSFASYKFVTYAFSIDTIEVAGNNIQVIVDQKKIPKNLFFFPADRIREEVLRDNPILADVQFQKKYPHTLAIVPTLRDAFAQLRSGGRTVLVDHDGVVLVDGDQGKVLPVLTFMVPALRVGEKVSDAPVLHAVGLLKMIHPLFPIESITEENGSYDLVKTDGMDILVPQDKAPADILATLQTLMAGFRIKGTLPAVVDLRFDKPVIKF